MNDIATLVRNETLAAARAAFAAFNTKAPRIMRIDWDASWDAMTTDQLYDLRDEFRAMLDSIDD